MTQPAVPQPPSTTTHGSRPLARLELAVLLGLLLLAAVVRLPGIDARGRWDADQGHDMLVLHALVTDGTVPLLGPKTSIGTFHHGAAYYYLLAPAAAVSGADPVAVTTEIALFGILAVLATWWLARMLGGPLAGAVAGLLAAVSPAGIDESTFIWNPNLIPFFAAMAFGGAVRARQTGKAWWWLVAGTGAMVTMQCHVLGVVIVVPLAAAWALEVRVRRRAGHPLKPLVAAGAGAVAIVAAGYVPLLVSELGHDFAETRAILDYIAGGGREATTGLPTLLALVGLRSVTWPLAGLVTDHVAGSLIAFLAAVLLVGVAVAGRRALGGRLGTAGVDVPSTRWLAASLAWSILALAIFAPSLAVVTPGLPNDHYHAFLDPAVLALAGVGIARIWGLRAGAGTLPAPEAGSAGASEQRGDARSHEGPAGGPAPALPRIIAGTLLAVLLVVAATAWPPIVSPDGGWPGADEAAAVVEQAAGGRPLALDGIPPFKSADALAFPLVRRGMTIVPEASRPPVVTVVCDPLFDEVVGAPCGGPAEDAWQAEGRQDLVLAQRFAAGPRRVVSIYEAHAQ